MSAQEEASNYTNKAIRFIIGLPSRSHIEFSVASMLPMPLRVDQLKLNHMLQVIVKMKFQ